MERYTVWMVLRALLPRWVLPWLQWKPRPVFSACFLYRPLSRPAVCSRAELGNVAGITRVYGTAVLSEAFGHGSLVRAEAAVD